MQFLLNKQGFIDINEVIFDFLIVSLHYNMIINSINL